MHNIELTLVGINYLVWNRVIIVENQEDIPSNKFSLACEFVSTLSFPSLKQTYFKIEE